MRRQLLPGPGEPESQARPRLGLGRRPRDRRRKDSEAGGKQERMTLREVGGLGRAGWEGERERDSERDSERVRPT